MGALVWFPAADLSIKAKKSDYIAPKNIQFLAFFHQYLSTRLHTSRNLSVTHFTQSCKISCSQVKYVFAYGEISLPVDFFTFQGGIVQEGRGRGKHNVPLDNPHTRGRVLAPVHSHMYGAKHLNNGRMHCAQLCYAALCFIDHGRPEGLWQLASYSKQALYQARRAHKVRNDRTCCSTIDKVHGVRAVGLLRLMCSRILNILSYWGFKLHLARHTMYCTVIQATGRGRKPGS